MTYDPNWESIDSRPTPAWFDEAKFGIFIHWGLYSVPSFAPKGKYAEWYWENMVKKDEYWDFHVKTYGEDFQYQDFVHKFTAEMFDPEAWAELFSLSGAKYVVPTSKHHDGFCLWPSEFAWNWNSVDVGPHRDLLGELTRSVRKYDNLKMGLYYSLYEWYCPLYLKNPAEYVEEKMLPQMREVIERYEPSILFTDGEWDHDSELWRSTEFLAWLFNEGPKKDEIVVNDRWGSETRSHHGGYYTTEYGEVGLGTELAEGHKWEECRGIGSSFGFNRNEELSSYMSSTTLVHLLVDMVSKGGNLLLNIGPTADGRIPVIMQERLLDMGRWLAVNGEAIYGTNHWRVVADDDSVCYTAKGNAVYAICKKWPGPTLKISGIKLSRETSVTMLGMEDNPLEWSDSGSELTVIMPNISPGELPCDHAYVIKTQGVT